MKRTIIFGAGQGGKMVKKLLRSDYHVIAFADRNQSKWGNSIDGVPIVSHQKALELKPDCIWIAILNREAVGQVYNQLLRVGFLGEINTLESLRSSYDMRLAELRMLAEEINRREVPGAVAELGVYRGEFAAEVNRLFPERTLHLFDTFEGFHEADLALEEEYGGGSSRYNDFSQASPEQVRPLLFHPDKAIFHKGFFPETIPDYEIDYAFVSLDVDLFASTYSGLCYFYPRLNKGGAIIIHDYNSMQYLGAGEATRKYCKENQLFVVPFCDFHGSALLVKY